MRSRKERESLAPLVGAVLAVVAYCLLLGPDFVSRGPSWFLHVGSEDLYPPSVRQIKQILGQAVPTSGKDGHDGREFWVLARDPLLLSPRSDRVLLDRPTYRAARIAYPVAAAPWRAFGETSLLIGLLITNLIIIGVGTYFTALLALYVRAPPVAAVFFAASPVVAVSLLLDLSDAMSLAALVASVYLFLRGRYGWATAVGVVAVLAKQPALLGLLAIAGVSGSLPLRRRFTYVAIPATAIILWTAYATARLGGAGSGIAGFTLPFFGYLHAVPYWVRHHLWPDAAISLATLPAAGAVIAQWWKRRTPLLAVALPFAVVVPFLSFPVLAAAIDSLRAFGPAITFFGLDWFTSVETTEPDDEDLKLTQREPHLV